MLAVYYSKDNQNNQEYMNQFFRYALYNKSLLRWLTLSLLSFLNCFLDSSIVYEEITVAVAMGMKIIGLQIYYHNFGVIRIVGCCMKPDSYTKQSFALLWMSICQCRIAILESRLKVHKTRWYISYQGRHKTAIICVSCSACGIFSTRFLYP